MSFLKNKIKDKLSLMSSEIRKECRSFLKTTSVLFISSYFFVNCITLIFSGDFLKVFLLSSLIFPFLLFAMLGLYYAGIKDTLKKISILGEGKTLDLCGKELKITPNSFCQTRLSEEEYNTLKKIPNEISLDESEINLLKRILFPNGINNKDDYINFLLELLKHETLKKNFEEKEEMLNGENVVAKLIDRIDSKIEHKVY